MSRSTRSKFMMFVSIIFAFYAVLWGLAPFDNINLPSRLILDSLDWPIDNFSVPLDKSTKLLSAIGAGLLGAISIFLGGIVVPAIRDDNKKIILTTIYAMTTWYVIDGIGSIASGVASNILFNSVYLVLVLIPLLWKGKDEKEIPNSRKI